jgi:hypothetical protein
MNFLTTVSNWRQFIQAQFSLVMWFVLVAIYILVAHKETLWKEKQLIRNDVVWYYSYLPATFIKGDPLWKFYEENKEHYDLSGQYWALKTEKGNYVPKMSMGKAFLDLPFFLVADTYTRIAAPEQRDGFSIPYHYLMMWSTLFYGLLGLFFLRKWLLTYTNELISGLTIIAIGLGTNIYFYTTGESGMSHPYNFFLVAFLLYYFPIWLTQPSWKKSMWFGVAVGFLILIRPINILILLPLFWMNLPYGKQLNVFIRQFFTNPQLFVAIGFAFFVWIPQLVFWKIQSGDWLYFSYQGEQFFWTKPHVWKGLFSFRKGWFVYTPMMIFAISGVVLLWKKHRREAQALILFLPLFFYVTFSWWCWWYGGSFGARTLVDILPLMALPLAITFQWWSKQKWTKAFFIIPLMLIYLNLFQSWQYMHGIIHYEAMTYEGYKTVFLKKYTPEGYWQQLRVPDWDNSYRYGEEKINPPVQ